MKFQRACACLCAAIALFIFAAPVPAQTGGRIQLAQLQAMFADMRAKTKWNVDGPMLWGYFFVDADPEKLKRAGTELQGLGYRVVGIEQSAKKRGYRLHVERVEAHSPASLDVRNGELYALAERYALSSYDGMDVGPVAASSAK